MAQKKATKKKKTRTTKKISKKKVSKTKSRAKTTASPQKNVEALNPEVVDSAKALAPSDPMARYLLEIRRYPLLTKEQEHALAVRYRETGDTKAAEALVTANLRFVVKVAAEYTKFGARLIDLVQEGNVGLMHAVREFNPYKGVRLITYAVWWIRGHIQEYLMRQYSMVRIGTTASQRKLFYQLQKQKEELDKLNPEDAVAQISGRLGVSEGDVMSMQQRLSGRDVSLDKPLNDSQQATLLSLQKNRDEESVEDQIATHEELEILRTEIDRIRPELSEKELDILESRLLSDEPLTLQDIGDKYQITREAVRQIEQRLIEKLRKQIVAAHKPLSDTDHRPGE